MEASCLMPILSNLVELKITTCVFTRHIKQQHSDTFFTLRLGIHNWSPSFERQQVGTFKHSCHCKSKQWVAGTVKGARVPGAGLEGCFNGRMKVEKISTFC